MTMSPPPTGEVLPVSKVRQWAVMPDGMLLSTRAPDGNWLPIRRLGYDDIRLVYRFEVVDWGPLGWASLIWILLGTLTLVLLALVKVPAEWMWVVVFLELAALMGGGVYVCQTKKKPMLRLEAYSGELVLPESNPQFFASLSQALASAEAWRQSAPPVPESYGYPAAAPESAQPGWQPYAGLPPLWTPQTPTASTPPTPPSEYSAPPPPEWQTPPAPPSSAPEPSAVSGPEPPSFPPPPPSYSAPSVQSAENPPSAPAGDSADATGENDRR